MDTFQEHPAEIFPFTVSGCSGLTHGQTCHLSDTQPGPASSGDVRVTTTPTAVRFTVTSNAYFDAPGSTITFSTEQRGRTIYLKQKAVAGMSQYGGILSPIPYLGAYYATWWPQALNLRSAMHKKMM